MIGIYKFENNINHNIYIGQSVDIARRYKDHLVRSKNNFKSNDEYDSPLHRAIRKYGIENFSFEIVEECKKEELNDKEIYWIDYYNSYHNGYNCTSGGDSAEHSSKLTEEIVNSIKKDLFENKLNYDELHEKYNISTGRISEINTGKIWKDNQYSYPIRVKTIKKQNYCIDCGTPLKDPRAIRCKKCTYKNRIIPIEKMSVTRDELKQLIRKIPFTEIGKKYQVTDNAIRKWCDKYNLPRTKKEISSYSDQEWEKI